MTPLPATPVELVRRYWDEVWNEGRVELVREICADPIVRYDPGSVTTTLSHAQQISRIRQQRTRRPYFTHEVLAGDADHAVSVWHMKTLDGEPMELCGIEVFRASGGRLSHCWNSGYAAGRWGRPGDPSAPPGLPPPAMLCSSDQIDREWLQRAFAAGGAVVPRIGLVTTITPIGHGTLSETVRVEFTYNADAAGAPTSVVCKFGAQTPGARQIARRFGLFAREAQTYRHLGVDPGFRMPRAWLMQTDPDGINVNLVLEDLSQSSVPGDQIAGCDRVGATAVVRELARMHARYWEDETLASASWLHDRTREAAALAATYRAGMEVFRARLFHAMPGRHVAIVEEFAEQAPDWLGRRPRWRTLVHGDARVDNVLFETIDGQPRACLIDWQLTGFGDPADDLAYFLSGSLDPDLRRDCERDLVAAHAACLREVEPEYTDDLAVNAYRDAICSGLLTTVCAAVSIAPGAANDRLLLTLATRNCDAVAFWH